MINILNPVNFLPCQLISKYFLRPGVDHPSSAPVAGWESKASNPKEHLQPVATTRHALATLFSLSSIPIQSNSCLGLFLESAQPGVQVCTME